MAKLTQDKAEALNKVKENWRNLSGMSDEFKNDRDIVLAAIKENGQALKYASDDLKHNKEIVLLAVDQNWKALMHASRYIKNNKEIVLLAIKQSWKALGHSSRYIKNNKEVVLEAIKQNTEALQYCSNHLKNNRNFILELVKKDWRALKYASDEVQNDKNFILAVVKLNGLALKYAKRWEQDSDICTAAVENNGLALEFCTISKLLHVTELRWVPTKKWHKIGGMWASREKPTQERPITLKAIKQNHNAFQYVSDLLKNDPGSLKAMARENGMILKFIDITKFSQEILYDISFTAVYNNLDAFQYISDQLKNDPRFLTAMARKNGMILKFIDITKFSQETLDDIFHSTIHNNPLAIEFASDYIKSNVDIIISLTEKFPMFLRLIDLKAIAQRDREYIADLVIEKDALALEAIDSEVFPPQIYERIVREATESNPFALRSAKLERFSQDVARDITLKAIQKKGYALQFATENFKDDKEIVTAAVLQNKNSIKYASKRLQNDPQIIQLTEKKLDVSNMKNCDFNKFAINKFKDIGIIRETNDANQQDEPKHDLSNMGDQNENTPNDHQQ